MALKIKIIFYQLVLVYCAILLYAVPVRAQSTTSYTLRLKQGNIPVSKNVIRWTDSMRANAAKEPALTYIHFTTLPDEAQKMQLLEKGIILLDYLPDNTFTALIKLTGNSGDLTALPIHSITDVKPEWKADNYMWKKISSEKGYIQVLVSFYSTVDAVAIRQFITTAGGEIIAGGMEKYGSYKVRIAANKVRSVASWHGIKYISPSNDMVPLDLQSRPAVKGNIGVNPLSIGGYGLNGDSVTVGVGDNGSGIYHADLKDRIFNFNPAALGNVHGEHVNGIVGGAANIDPMAEGMATHVSLTDHLYDLIFPSLGAMYRDYNMTITNNSYAVTLGNCDYAGTYDAYAQLIDTLAMEYPEVLNVFAAGNDGSNNCSPYVPGFATMSGGYQPAKNNVVVGSMTDYLGEAGDESRGPVKDGRLKPEIIAVGLGAYSTVLIDDYRWDAGTSMASPQVAGGLALLTQRYKQLHGGSNPKADVLKTILLNGTMDLGNPGPDYSYGFGAMDIYRSLQILDNARYSTNIINNNDSQTITIPVTANTAQLKVMLYWNDRPASPSSARQLVNDLDITVTTPAGDTHLPLVLDNTPGNVNNNATEQQDHLNNAEQVIITNPAAGNYTVKVKGFSVPYPAQKYVVAYDLLPKGVQLTYPKGGEAWENTDTLRVFWEAVGDSNMFTVEFSTDNGSTWNTLSNTVPAWARYYGWIPAGINSGHCLVRVSRNGTTETSVSSEFVINTIPVIHLDTAQCPGYINIHWPPVINAAQYELLKKDGPFMRSVGTTTDTAYSFSGMPIDSRSYVAMRPYLNGIGGYRSVAIIATANTGNCTNPVSAGDLMIEKVLGPVSGRMHTSSQLTNSETLSLQVRDLYNSACSSYIISYSINSGPWQSFAGGASIPANGTQIINIPGIDLSAAGSYAFNIAIQNTSIADPVASNDTVKFTIQNIANDTLLLPFTDGFESMPVVSVSKDSIGISPNGHWDFHTGDTSGRMRSFVSDDVNIAGNRSISMDENQAVINGSRNVFTGTFNLAAYDTASTEVRMDFDYVLHGTPKTASGNQVQARASDTTGWANLFMYDLNAYPGALNHVHSLSLTDLILANNKNFTTSSQIAFGQNDTSLIASPEYGNGITLDNVKLYTVANDAQLVQVLSPLPTNCGLPSPQPLTVQVHNGVNYTLHNVQLFYSLDSGVIYSGIIDSISGKATVSYTFSHPLDLSAIAAHKLNVWLTEAGDTYTINDSLLGYKFRNSRIFTTYPYLENFETGDGGYYSDGINNSWQYGTPASSKINKAASGTKAWKTNLTGHYNNLELSYLYSPCFDISSLANPMLSFSTAQDVENCGNVMCDRAYIEYTFDGLSWTKLGTAGQGTNWYDSAFDVWNTNGFIRWHVASIPLPQPPAGATIHFRFVLNSDPGSNFEGFAVDDIHIFDRAQGIYPANGVSVLSKNIVGSTWIDYDLSNQLLAAVMPGAQALGNTAVTLYAHDTLYNPGSTQYTYPRSYTIKSSINNTDSVGIRLYLREDEFVRTLNDTTCPSCTITDAYSLGITQYNNPVSATENGTLTDDVDSLFTYYPYKSVQWVPYDQGYYAEAKVRHLGELWFNDGGPTGNFPAGIDYLNLVAYKNGSDVNIVWQSLIDTAVITYTLQRSADSINFISILDTDAAGITPANYSYTDVNIFPISPVWYYRLKWTMKRETRIYYSPIIRVASNADSSASIVDFDAEMKGSNTVHASWTSYIDGITKHYTLEREISNGGYTTINTTSSQRHYAQHYTYTDMPGIELQKGTILHYRLTAITDDNKHIILPIRTVEWGNNNFVTNIYPNPNNDGNITIAWHASPGSIMNVSIIDMTGRVRYTTSVVSAQNNNTTSLQTFHRPKGNYLVRIQIGDAIYTADLVYQ